MKIQKTFFIILTFCSFSYADEALSDADIAKLSESLGHMIGKQMDSLGITIDAKQVVQGLQKAKEGKEPLLSEEECLQMITSFQEKLVEKESANNLKKAEEFLEKNSKVSGVKEIVANKLQYQILKEGSGKALEAQDTPLIKYIGKYLDGTVFDENSEGATLPLMETILGFQKGLLGMREKEVRKLYIHPELSYGKAGPLAPNALITFEVELLQKEAPKQEKEIVQAIR